MPLRDVQTIIFVMMENRSFDHVLGYLAGAGLAVEGVGTAAGWCDAHANAHGGARYPVHRLSAATQSFEDPPHDHAAIARQLGTDAAPMSGFVESYMTRQPPPADPGVVMGHYDAASVPTYDFLARHFAVCDHWFAALPTGTQANRLMAMAGQSPILDNASVFLPDMALVYDWLSARGVSWCAYQWGDFLPFVSLMPRWLPEIAASLALAGLADRGHFRRFAQFRAHWTGADAMPSVIFVEPEYTDGPHAAPNDDHPPSGVARGQAFLAELYAALLANPARWRDAALIVTYDEHGGFFDHVRPLPIPAVAGGVALATTGVRVPAFVVSPHVAPGVPFTDPLDHTSFLQLLADRFDPHQVYSPEVSARQAHLGRLSTVFTEVPSPSPTLPLTAHLAIAETSDGQADSAGSARTVSAFDAAARKIAADHPELLAEPGWRRLADYLDSLPAVTPPRR